MKKLTALVMLLALVAMTGVVMADSSGTTPVNADVQPLMLTLSAPSDIGGWSLTRGIDNDKPNFDIIVSTNDGAGVPCRVVVTTDNGGKMYFTPDNKASYLQTPLNIWTPGGYVPLSTPVELWTTPTLSTTPVNIPVGLRQFVTSTDVAHAYTINVIFTLEQVP